MGNSPEIKSLMLSNMADSRFLPLKCVKMDPRFVFLALRSPPTIIRHVEIVCIASHCCCVCWGVGCLFIADIVNGPMSPSMRVVVA